MCRNTQVSHVARRTCRASVPGCCSSFTVLPPAVFCPRPSCQVRFPPVRRLSWCLKSSGRALYSRAGLQKLKLDAAGEIKAQGITVWQLDLPETTNNVKRKKKAHSTQKAPSFCVMCQQKAERSPPVHPVIQGWSHLITKYLLAHALLILSSHRRRCKAPVPGQAPL